MPDLTTDFVHLGPGASATVEPPFTAPISSGEWYADYSARHAADGAEGRLVSQYDFAASWTSWENHPSGTELVICTAGMRTLIQQHPDGRTQQVVLHPGDYAINPPGTWHTADVPDGVTATAIFITAGEGTQHRPC